MPWYQAGARDSRSGGSCPGPSLSAPPAAVTRGRARVPMSAGLRGRSGRGRALVCALLVGPGGARGMGGVGRRHRLGARRMGDRMIARSDTFIGKGALVLACCRTRWCGPPHSPRALSATCSGDSPVEQTSGRPGATPTVDCLYRATLGDSRQSRKLVELSPDWAECRPCWPGRASCLPILVQMSSSFPWNRAQTL